MAGAQEQHGQGHDAEALREPGRKQQDEAAGETLHLGEDKQERVPRRGGDQHGQGRMRGLPQAHDQ